jgi:hypothetical protein
MGIASGSHKTAQAMKKAATFQRAVDAISDTNHRLAARSKIAIGVISKLRGATYQNGALRMDKYENPSPTQTD